MLFDSSGIRLAELLQSLTTTNQLIFKTEVKTRKEVNKTDCNRVVVRNPHERFEYNVAT
jgi:hypothetical protein